MTEDGKKKKSNIVKDYAVGVFNFSLLSPSFYIVFVVTAKYIEEYDRNKQMLSLSLSLSPSLCLSFTPLYLPQLPSDLKRW